MNLRYERLSMQIAKPFRLLHISDVHFSARTGHEKNQCVTDEILEQAQAVHCPIPEEPDISTPLQAICITGDLISRKYTQDALDDAVSLLQRLRELLPDTAILYSLGNHEMDLPPDALSAFLTRVRGTGVTVLDNSQTQIDGICFAGLTLPQTVYKNPNGGYLGLAPITGGMVKTCLGAPQPPCILLAHTPLGFAAYAEWGAKLVLSGHVHGGIVRVGNTGLLSPERRFLPRYTKGFFLENGCAMNVSAGIGKLRIHNPAELICIDIQPIEDF